MSFVVEKFRQGYRRVRHVFERSKGLVAGPVSTMFNRGLVKPPRNVETYFKYYKNNSSVRKAVDTLAEMIAGAGHYSEVEEEESERAKEIVDELAERIRLDEKLLNAVKCMLIAGFCPIERIVQRGPPPGIIELKILDPRSMKYRRDKKGKILGYDQYHEGQKSADFKSDELIWFVYDEVGNNKDVLYGVSLIESILDLLSIRDQTITNIDGIMAHQARPPIIWKVAQPSDRDTLQAALKDRAAEEDLVVAPKDSIDHETVKVDIRAPYWEYVQYIDSQIFEGLHAPLLNYLRNATEASAKVMLEAIERHTEGIQRYLKRMVEHEIYEFHLNKVGWHGEVPAFRWGQPATGVEEVDVSDFLKEGLKLGYVTRSQYFQILRSAGLNVQFEEEPEEEAEEEEAPEEEEPEEAPSEGKT